MTSCRHQVFFCTPSPGSTKQITFRPPREEDHLGSYLRQHIFRSLLQRELAFDTILGRANDNHDPEDKMLLTDDSNPLSGWQEEAAPHHWQRESIDSTFISLSVPVSPPRTFVIPPVHRPPSPHSVLNGEIGGRLPFSFPSFTSPASDLLMNQYSIARDERCPT